MTIEKFEGRMRLESAEITNGPIKILHQIDFFPGFQKYSAGGAERVLQRLVTAFDRDFPNNYRNLIYVFHERNADVEIPVPSSIHFVGDSNKGAFIPFLIKERNKFDILHIAAGFPLPSRLLASVSVFWPKSKPVIARVASESHIDTYKKANLLERNILLNRVDIFVALSEELVKGLEDAGIESEKIVLIPNGVDTNVFKPVERESKRKSGKELFDGRVAENKLVFLYNGRLMEETKKTKTLVEAWKSTNLASYGHFLVLVGPIMESDQNEILQFRKQIDEGNDYNIIWAGQKSPEEAVEYYQASDLFVFPSVEEGMSNSLVEAMSCGLVPIVRKGVSGNGLLVNNGNTGFDFDKDNDLSRLMIEVAGNPGMLAEISKNARQRVVNNFDLNDVVRKYDILFQSVANKTKK